MEPEVIPEQQQREACLPWMLGIFFVAFFVLTLTVATGGYFVYVLGLVAAVSVLAAMHYALWGRGLDEKVAGEREVEEAQEWPTSRPTGEDDRRFRRPRGSN